jgi:hypothetical protein
MPLGTLEIGPNLQHLLNNVAAGITIVFCLYILLLLTRHLL